MSKLCLELTQPHMKCIPNVTKCRVTGGDSVKLTSHLRPIPKSREHVTFISRPPVCFNYLGMIIKQTQQHSYFVFIRSWVLVSAWKPTIQTNVVEAFSGPLQTLFYSTSNEATITSSNTQVITRQFSYCLTLCGVQEFVHLSIESSMALGPTQWVPRAVFLEVN
jgi:hypothetical protein